MREVPIARRTVVGEIDRLFDNLSGSHLQSHLVCFRLLSIQSQRDLSKVLVIAAFSHIACRFACRSGDCYRCGHDLSTMYSPSNLLQWSWLLFANRLYGRKCVCAEKQATGGCMFHNIDYLRSHTLKSRRIRDISCSTLNLTMEFYFRPKFRPVKMFPWI